MKRFLFAFLFFSSSVFTQAPADSSVVCKGYGYFDHLLIEQDLIKDHINLGKSFSAHSAEEIIDDGLQAVVSISHSLKSDDTEQQWRSKLRGAASSINEYNPDDVAWVLIQDEPFLKDFTSEQIRRIVELAKEINGDEYKYGYTFTRNAILKYDIPDNLDVVGTNFYPFIYKDFGDVWIRTEKKGYNPPVIEGNAYPVGKPDNIDKKWDIWVVFNGEKKHVSFESVEESPIEPKPIWHSLWDASRYSGDEFNTKGMVHPNDAKNTIGKNVFISLSHTFKNTDINNFTPEEQANWKAVLRGWKDDIQHSDPERVRILLQDEPLSNRPNHLYKNFKVEELNWLVDTAHEVFGDEYKVGYSLTRNDVLTSELPKADFFIPTMYVFIHEEYWQEGYVRITNRQEFDDYFDMIVSTLRSKTDAELFVTGQGFHGDHWRQPPLECPQWYLEAAWRNDLKGLLWWEVGKPDPQGRYKGLATMPEYFDEIVGLNEKIPG